MPSFTRIDQPSTAPRHRTRSRGQVIVIFAGAMLLLVMMVAIVVDVSWYWVNSLRVQRAADAAALAGAVMLPNDQAVAVDRAFREAAKNGYPDGAGVTISTLVRTGSPRRLEVTIHAEVGTFFMRVLGLTAIPITRTAKAEFAPPVPMGSPQNYYGVGVLNVPTPHAATTGFDSAAEETGDWVNPNDANSSLSDVSANWAFTPLNGAETPTDSSQQWQAFGLQNSPDIPEVPSLEIVGIELRSRAFLDGGSGASDGCRMQAELSWDNGNAWTASKDSGQLPTIPPGDINDLDPTPYNVRLGDDNDTWGHNWTYDQLANNGGESFRVRLTFRNGTGCENTRRLAVDTLEIRVSYRYAGAPTAVPVKDPYGIATLVPQKFWGAMQSQGAPSVQGDAFMTGFTSRKDETNPKYDPQSYFNYGIDMPAGGGEVWIFDPGFCDTSVSDGLNLGTGESWTLSPNNDGGNGSDPARPVSAQYNLYNTNGTPFDYTDDTLIKSSGDTFRRMYLTDPDLGGNSGVVDVGGGRTVDYGSPADCGGMPWHNDWWKIQTGPLAAGVYRLHTTSRIYTDPKGGILDAGDNQRDSTGLNAFAIWSRSGGSASQQPRVYGLGAMEAYFPLPSETSVFYLAQIDKVHAGKWMDIDLWDPGDTGNLSATLRILEPNGGAGQVADFFWNAIDGTTMPTNFACGESTNGPVSSIPTNAGGGSTGIYNGRWLRICIKIDDDYAAPTDPASGENGWWKIQYEMSGSGASTDLTTWQVTIRDSPVHLVLPGE